MSGNRLTVLPDSIDSLAGIRSVLIASFVWLYRTFFSFVCVIAMLDE